MKKQLKLTTKKITEFTVDIDAPPGLFSERIELARSAAAVAYRRLITDGMLMKDKLAKEKEKQKKMEQNALDKAACLQPQEVLEKWATGFLQSRFGKGKGKGSSKVADLVDYGSMLSLAILPPQILKEKENGKGKGRESGNETAYENKPKKGKRER